MPSYTLKCSACGDLKVSKMTFDEYRMIEHDRIAPQCEVCKEGFRSIAFTPGQVGLVLKEGPSGGWLSKSLRENKFRARHGEIISKRQKDHVRPSDLVPNYNGQVHDRWSEVQDHVRAEKGIDAAKTYEPYVKKEVGK